LRSPKRARPSLAPASLLWSLFLGFCILVIISWYTPVVTGMKYLVKGAHALLKKQQYSGILILLLLISALHFSTIMQPAQPVFDEQYYVPAAQSILQDHGTDRTEHPPLGQLIIASGIRLFGDNPFGWRFFSVLFGDIGVFLFYLICLRLKIPRKYAYLAAFLLSFENLTFIQSSLAMLDVFSLTFMLAAFWFYLRGNYLSSGLMTGLAALAKLTGLLALPVIVLHWLITNRRELKPLFTQILAAPAALLGLMPLLDFAVWHKWLSPFSQLSTMLQLSSGSTFAKYPSEMLSRPWEWVFKPEILTYWIEPHYLAMISPVLWALIIPATGFVIYQALKHNTAAIFALVWFTGTYLIWIPASLAGDRVSYVYYFYPAVGSVCLALTLMAFSLEKFNNLRQPDIWKKLMDWIVPLYMLLSLGTFVILSPVSYWWKAPLCLAAYLFSRYYLSVESDIERIK
jgi:dolichyl-phosphate-mannose-protein mannosyltransferase